MALITKYFTWIDGTGDTSKITADRINTNYDRLYTLVNGQLNEANIKAASGVPLIAANYTISGTWTFSTDPAFGTSTKIVRTNVEQTFTSKQTMTGGIDLNKCLFQNIILESLAAVPSYVAADKGRVIYCTGDNKFYGANNAAWTQMDYTGAYTGGSIRSYSSEVIVDSNNPAYVWFKTEGVSPTVTINLKAYVFPTFFYTEIGTHTHAFSGAAHTHTITDPGHTHTIALSTHTHAGSLAHATHTHAGGSHTHTLSGTTGGDSPDHTHIYAAYSSGPATNTSGESVGHTHDIATTSDAGGTAATGAPSATDSVSSADLGTPTSNANTTGISTGSSSPAGTVTADGINGGTENDTLKAYPHDVTLTIDTTSITVAFLAAAVLTELGDGTSGHAIVTTGSGEIDVSAMATMTAGYHKLKIAEPVAKSGCKFLVHIETT